MRHIVLDTETTGLEWKKGNRVVEIGCVELLERRPTGRTFHKYLNPDREFEAGAQEVTGLTLEFLADKPRFAEIAEEFLAFAGARGVGLSVGEKLDGELAQRGAAEIAADFRVVRVENDLAQYGIVLLEIGPGVGVGGVVGEDPIGAEVECESAVAPDGIAQHEIVGPARQE